MWRKLKNIWNAPHRWRLMLELLLKRAKWVPDKLFLSLCYWLKFRKPMNWRNPQGYNEKLQWLKLYDRRPEYSQMVCKYEAKKDIAKQVGEQYVIPALGVWERAEEINFDGLPDRFVLKTTHDSGTVLICKDKSLFNLQAAVKVLNKSLSRNYFYQNREWPYKTIKPRIIAEPYLADNPKCSDAGKMPANSALQAKFGLLDYKFMCFGGEVKLLFLDIGVVGNSWGHASEYYRSIFDRDFHQMPFCETRAHYPGPIEKPECFDEMVCLAEKLSKGIPHLRVDMYYIDGQIKIGELTFFHGSGLTNCFDPESWNDTLGSWIQLPEPTTKKRNQSI